MATKPMPLAVPFGVPDTLKSDSVPAGSVRPAVRLNDPPLFAAIMPPLWIAGKMLPFHCRLIRGPTVCHRTEPLATTFPTAFR